MPLRSEQIIVIMDKKKGLSKKLGSPFYIYRVTTGIMIK